MNCIIIEDQPPAQRILKKYIADIGSLNLKATFSDAIQALDFLKSETVDLIFLDIHLPKISGLDFLKTLQNPPVVILTTAFPDYALESYEFNVADYLLKPFSFQRFVKAVSKVLTQKTVSPKTVEGENTGKEIFIKSGYEYIKISPEDILYIKSDADYTEIILPDKRHLSTESLRFWSENLNSEHFLRIHKSYIVNTSKIHKFSGNQIHLTGSEVLPVGRAFKEEFLKRFINQS
jgi:DNA-binding LytR/AlgR family response regulator